MCYYKFNIAPQSAGGGPADTESKEDYSVAAGTEPGLTCPGSSCDPLIDAFKWRSAEENDLLDFRRMGGFGDYTGSGFVVDITNLTTVSLVDTLSFLKVWPCSWQPLQARSRDTPA